jgi:HPt (histidine-containing phosphotransfer) domain-containing protein
MDFTDPRATGHGTGEPGAAEAAQGSAMSHGTKPIDLVYLRRFTQRNTELEREVLGLFVDGSQNYITGLKVAKTQRNWHSAAHTLKGAARAIGAWRIARLAEAAERLNIELEPGRRHEAIANIVDAIDEATHYILDTVA